MRVRRGIRLLLVLAMVLALLPARPVRAASFTVNSTADKPDVSPGDGICDADLSPAVTECTLMAAIQEANFAPGSTISLPSGTYQFGQYDVRANVTITGGGQDTTTLTGDGSDSGDGFAVRPDVTLVMSDLTLDNGSNVVEFNGKTLSLTNVTFTNNVCALGIAVGSTATLNNVTVARNGLVAGTLFTATPAIRDSGTMTMSNSSGGPTGSAGRITFTPPAGTQQVTFFVRHNPAGSTATVPFVVRDGCGNWSTFVGGGPSAF